MKKYPSGLPLACKIPLARMRGVLCILFSKLFPQYNTLLHQIIYVFTYNMLIKDSQCIYAFLYVIVVGFPNYFVFKIHYSRLLTMPPV